MRNSKISIFVLSIMDRVPRYIYFMVISAVIIFSLNLIAHNFYEQIGYVSVKSSDREAQITAPKNELDSLTISFEVIMRDPTDTAKDEIRGKDETFPSVKSESPKPNVERSITFKQDDLQDISDKEYFEKLKKDYLQEIIKNIPPGKSRTDLVVRYYKRSGDNNSGIYELQEMRYYIHERNVDGETEYYPNNFISYGKNINKEDLQIVAYTLLKNGIPIKSIQPSKYGADWKANSIEIGNDASLDEENVLSLKDVRAFVK